MGEVLEVIKSLVNGKFKAKFGKMSEENRRYISTKKSSNGIDAVERRVDIAGMTCDKCERLIREGILESVPGVSHVQVFRQEGYALLTLKSDQPHTRSEVIKVINSLVNGKFKAKFRTDANPASFPQMEQ